LCLLFVGAAAGDTVTVAAERFKLVDEFIDHIPGPVVLYGKNRYAQLAIVSTAAMK
jgi:hypothetical protein